MRTLLASVALATASAAMAHEGHGEAPAHWHGGDLIALLAIGVAVGQQMSSALAGKSTVDQALKASQVAADREMRKGGYYK